MIQHKLELEGKGVDISADRCAQVRSLFLHVGSQKRQGTREVPEVQIRQMEHAPSHGHLQEVQLYLELPQRYAQEVPAVRFPSVGHPSEGQPLPQMQQHLGVKINGGTQALPQMLVHRMVPGHPDQRQAEALGGD